MNRNISIAVPRMDIADRMVSGHSRDRIPSGRGTAICNILILTDNLLMPCPYSCLAPDGHCRSHVILHVNAKGRSRSGNPRKDII
ncbi:MAG: hypothetical protein AB4352_12255 [Hormoscilla sp.]